MEPELPPVEVVDLMEPLVLYQEDEFASSIVRLLDFFPDASLLGSAAAQVSGDLQNVLFGVDSDPRSGYIVAPRESTPYQVDSCRHHLLVLQIMLAFFLSTIYKDAIHVHHLVRLIPCFTIFKPSLERYIVILYLTETGYRTGHVNDSG
jgi:hypothetical protein